MQIAIVMTMSIIRIIAATLLLSSALMADDHMVASNGMMTTQSVGAAVTAVTPLPDSAEPGQKRTFVLILGITALVVAFHRGLANRKTTL